MGIVLSGLLQQQQCVYRCEEKPSLVKNMFNRHLFESPENFAIYWKWMSWLEPDLWISHDISSSCLRAISSHSSLWNTQSACFGCARVNQSICDRIALRYILVPVVNKAIISPLLVYDYVNSGYGRMEPRWLYSCSTWGKINMAIADPILADLKKSGKCVKSRWW